MQHTLQYKKYIVTPVILTLFVLAFGLLVFKLSGGQLLSVQSGSMVPEIRKGDLVAVTRVPEAKLAVGDVVTYRDPIKSSQTITHRIVALPNAENQYKIITKGDANALPDTPIAPERIIGVKALSVPYVGYILDFARRPAGLFLLIYIPAFWLLGAEIKHLKEAYKARETYYASEAIRKQLEARRIT